MNFSRFFKKMGDLLLFINKKGERKWIFDDNYFRDKNCRKFDRKLSKIGFVTPKIVVNGNKLTKIVTINFFLNKNTAQGACKNIKKSIIFKTKIVENLTKNYQK